MGARITKEDVIDFLKEGGKFIGALALKIYGKTLDQAGEQAFSEAIDLEIKNTVAALYDAKVSDKEILRVVGEHWGISSQEVEDLLVKEKYQAAIRALKQHLRLQGYSNRDIDAFIQENMVLIKIRRNNDLWRLKDNPEKLLKAIKNTV